jgi:tetratricopeptide (TPR) repeat protein
MAKAVASVDKTSVTATHSENKEATTLLWFDPNIGSREETEQTKKQLRLINDYVIFHTDLELCIAFIQSTSNEKIFLITSGSKASQLLPRISTFRQIDSIFVFCMKIDKYQHLTNEYSGIIGIYNDLDALCTSIREQVDLVDKQIQAFSFFDQHQKSVKDLSKESAEFLWFQLFNHVILRLPRNKQAKQQMINVCRQYYRGNTKELRLIDEFEREYRSEEAIRWYSKQSFVYKLVNQALRSGDIDQLHVFRFYIGDLSESLAREHEKVLSSKKRVFTVYRGLKLDKEEFDKLKENQGKLISTNGYLSTSRLRSPALTFAMKPTQRKDVVPVLFQIECNVKELGKSVIFADIAQFSEFPYEEEVLFDLSAAFRLESIEQDGTVQLIRMSATNAGETITKDYIELIHRETEEISVSIVFGRLMCSLGEYDKSQTYFEQLLNDPNGEDVAWIEFNIGRAFDFKGERKEAREYYDRAYDRMMNAKPKRIKDAAYVLTNIGAILREQAKFDDALDCYQRVLKMQQKYCPPGDVAIARSLFHIGNTLRKQNKNEEALYYYQRVLEINEKNYPPGHAHISNILTHIGLIFMCQKKLDEAMEYCQRAFTIREKYYPSGHIEIARSLVDMGRILSLQEKFDEALDYYQQGFKLQEKYYSADHIFSAPCLNDIGFALDKQGKHDEALDYHQRALKIREKYYPEGHGDVAQSLNNIGLCYEHQNKRKTALDYYQRALVIYEKFLPDGHADRVMVKSNIRRVSGKS